jgi:hypothetical protein
MPDKLVDDLTMLEKWPKAGVVFSDAIQIDAGGRELKTLRTRAYSGSVTEKIIQNNFVLMATHLAKTELIRSIGGFREERSLAGSEDWEMWVRLSTVTDFVYLRKANTKIRTHDANTMTDTDGMDRSMNYAVDLMEQSDYLSLDKTKAISRARATVSLVNAINYCSSDKAGAALRNLSRAFLFDPYVLLDLRFGYTIARLLSPKRVLSTFRNHSR